MKARFAVSVILMSLVPACGDDTATTRDMSTPPGADMAMSAGDMAMKSAGDMAMKMDMPGAAADMAGAKSDMASAKSDMAGGSSAGDMAAKTCSQALNCVVNATTGAMAAACFTGLTGTSHDDAEALLLCAYAACNGKSPGCTGTNDQSDGCFACIKSNAPAACLPKIQACANDTGGGSTSKTCNGALNCVLAASSGAVAFACFDGLTGVAQQDAQALLTCGYAACVGKPSGCASSSDRSDACFVCIKNKAPSDCPAPILACAAN